MRFIRPLCREEPVDFLMFVWIPEAFYLGLFWYVWDYDSSPLIEREKRRKSEIVLFVDGAFAKGYNIYIMPQLITKMTKVYFRKE